MRATFLVALFGVLLANLSAAQDTDGTHGLDHLLARADVVVVGSVAAVTPYDSGRITLAQVRVASVLKGAAPTEEVLVLERHDLPSSPQLLQAADHVLVFLVPATRSSSLRQALPPGTYYDLVEGRAGVLASRHAGDVQEAAGIVTRLVGSTRTPEPDATRRAAAARTLVLDELAARQPAIVADGAAGLGRIPNLAQTLTSSEHQRLETALNRTDLPAWVRVALVNAVAERGLTALVPTLRKLSAPTPELRRASWAALIRLGASPSADDLEPALTNADPAVRAAAAHGLVAAQGATALPAVTHLALADPNRDVQSAAIEALGESKLPEALPSLEQAFANPNWELRQTAGRAIFVIGGRPAAESLARLAFEGPPDAQKYAVVLLLASGVPRDDPLVERIRTTHPDEGVRHIAEGGMRLREH